MNRWIFVLLVFPLAALATPGDDKFLAAREAYRVGEPARLARIGDALRSSNPEYELQSWVDYWTLSAGINETSNAAVEEFLSRNGGAYLADKLRGEWLKAMGRRGDWANFMPQYPLVQDPDVELRCYFWQAQMKLGAERAMLRDVRELWFLPAELPASCAPLTDQLVTDKQLNADDVWARIRALLDQSKYAEAQIAARYLPDGEMIERRTLERVAAKPQRFLDHLPANMTSSRALRESTLFALLRLARKDVVDAAQRWRRMESRFDANDRGYLWGQFARLAARQHMSEALAWYEAAGATPLTDDQQLWRVRAALRAQNWKAVLRAIDTLSSALAARPDWIYWRARALAASGSKQDAETAAMLYRSIASQPNFYGLLAADEINLPFVLPPRAAPVTPEELARASANQGLRQAFELLRLDMRTEAIREWNWTVRNMSDRDLLAAAELARRNDVFDRAISTADRTLNEHDYTLRYLAPYRDAVSPKAQALDLDDSWVYGLMRQESRFITSARSNVGARGLMQVMPSTARIVARRIGMAHYRPGHAEDMDTNVTLGTHYMKMVLESLDNLPLLASAAYNAGPGRAQRWRGDQSLEGAIYAETIPFDETRDYVKKVMANAVYYAALFNEKPQSLKIRLGMVQPRGVNGALRANDGGAEP